MSDVPAIVPPQPQPVPVAPIPASAPVATPTPQQPISTSDRVQVDGKEITVGDLLAGYRWQNQNQDSFDTYQKAFNENDPAAIQSLLQQYSGAQPVQMTPEQAELANLKEQMSSLTQSLAQMQPTMHSVTAAQRASQMSNHILQNAVTFPRLAANPQVASQLAQTLQKGMEQQVRDAGADPGTPQMQQALMSRALQHAELAFNGGQPLAAAPVPGAPGIPAPMAASNPVSFNDQSNPLTPQPTQPFFTEIAGQIYRTADLQQQAQPLPSTPVAPVPGGSPVAMGQTGPAPGTGFSSTQLLQQMSERAVVAGGAR